MSLKGAVQIAHSLASDILREGAVVVDATAGNGHDTAFLAAQVGTAGHVYAFDIQEKAIQQTGNRLKEVGIQNRVTLIQDSHHNALHYLGGNLVDLALFNLGYLPGGDKQLVTQSKTTLLAAEQLLEALTPQGRLLLVLYPGHPEGRSEAKIIETWASALDQVTFTVQKIAMLNQVNHPPYVIAIEKKSQTH